MRGGYGGGNEGVGRRVGVGEKRMRVGWVGMSWMGVGMEGEEPYTLKPKLCVGWCVRAGAAG